MTETVEDKERIKAVDALDLAYLKKQRIEEAFVAIRQGASAETRRALLKSILAAENSEIGGSTGKIKMALKVVSLEVPTIQHFVNQIIKENWLESEAERRVFIESKDNMPVVAAVIEAVIEIHISNGHLLASQKAARLLGRELSVDEINAVIEKRCRSGNIEEALDAIRTTKLRNFTPKEIKILTEAVDKQQSSKSKAT